MEPHELRTRAQRMIKRLANGYEDSTLGPATTSCLTQIVSTLLLNGFSVETLGSENIGKITLYLQTILGDQQGLLGFAPKVLADAEDTAKTMLILELLGIPANPDRMIDRFKSKDGHPRTYPGERDTSFSANCNVLMALLLASEAGNYIAKIIGLSSFLCDCWWRGAIKDKWNKSDQYSMMLLAEALVRLLFLWDRGLLSGVPETLVNDRIPVVTIQILNRTLFAQTETGGWGADGASENTAYGILTLRTLSSLPWHTLLQDRIVTGIASGQQFLSQSKNEWTKPAKLWIGKVMYGSAELSEAYCLAAMKTSKTSRSWSQRITDIIRIDEKQISKLVNVFSSLKGFRNEPHWKLMSSAIEGFTFLQQLKSARMDILPCQKDAKNEYMAYVPITWTLINNLLHLNTCTNLLWDMMVLTVCIFRLDEYIETSVARFSKSHLELTKVIIRDLCAAEVSIDVQTRDQSLKIPVKVDHVDEQFTTEATSQTKSTPSTRSSLNGDKAESTAIEVNGKHSVSPLVSFRATIGHYTRAMLAYPRVVHASPADQAHYRSLLRSYLLSHISQVTDNSRFATQSSWNSSATSVFVKPRTSFYTWAHSTGADSVACPIAFAFLICILGSTTAASTNSGKSYSADEFFGSARQKYLAEDLCSHLAVMSRLYNDYGSIVRDRLEANINSVNFPEFHSHSEEFHATSRGNSATMAEEKLKRELLEIAEYERNLSDATFQLLLSDMEGVDGRAVTEKEKAKVNGLRLFVGVVMLYADVAEVRDISNYVGEKR